MFIWEADSQNTTKMFKLVQSSRQPASASNRTVASFYHFLRSSFICNRNAATVAVWARWRTRLESTAAPRNSSTARVPTAVKSSASVVQVTDPLSRRRPPPRSPWKPEVSGRFLFTIKRRLNILLSQQRIWTNASSSQDSSALIFASILSNPIDVLVTKVSRQNLTAGRVNRKVVFYS